MPKVRELHRTSGKIRNLPLSARLKTILNNAARETNLQVDVVSGGQPPLGQGTRRTGSTRHDVGGGRMGAADLMLLDPNTLRVLVMTGPADQKRMAAFVTACVRQGAVGVGAGVNYMGPSVLHIGGGNSAVWGGTRPGMKPPTWLTTAHAAGLRA